MTRTKALAFIAFCLLLCTGFADWRVFALSSEIGSNQQDDTRALCAFRQDLSRRLVSGKDFLISHPHGIPGISAGTIRVSLLNEQSTLSSLRALKC